MAKDFENIFSSNWLNYIPGIPLDLADPALSRSDNFTGKYGIELSNSWYQNHKNTWKEKNLDNKIMLEKGALRNIIETTKNLTPEETITKLELYQGVTLGKDVLNKSGKDALNMFEMMALYQRSIQLFWDLELVIDARFGPKTFKKLMKTQKDVLHFEWKAPDGIPGPKTTKAIINALKMALNTSKNSDHITSLAADKLGLEIIAMQKYGNDIISKLHAQIISDKSELSKKYWKNPTKTFFSWNDENDIKYAYITEGNIVSVWGEINTENKTRPLILMEWGNVIYVGELLPNNTLADKMGAWPVWKREKIDYKYLPKMPENRSNKIATVIK